jgi:hypothetical protein
MFLIAPFTLVLALLTGQSDERPAYARESERIEQEFSAYRDRLNKFFTTLRSMIDQQPASASINLPRLELQDSQVSANVRFGYGVLPRIVEAPPPAIPPVSVFSYSWPITDGYIAGEKIRLDQAEEQLRAVADASSEMRSSLIRKLILDYRTMAANQRTVDQYIQYNEFWQRAIAQDRARFDQLTKVYELMKSDQPDMTLAIREVLGTPNVPEYIQIDRSTPGSIILRVPVYTDIQDPEFLSRAKGVIEDAWRVVDGDITYRLEIEYRNVDPVAEPGARIDVRAHAARFPEDGAVLTSGAQTTHSLVGRYVALATGDLSTRALAHEFGHILGFRDGYIRGYRDLGDQGFEILELTSVFDDIMSAPREGNVQAAHFRLMIENLRRN